MTSVSRPLSRLCLMVAFALAAAGCENEDNPVVASIFGTSSSSSTSSGSSSTSSVTSSSQSAFVGTWSLTNSDNDTWYIHFDADSSWMITDGSSRSSRRRVYGTYTTSGNSFSGNMTNDGVGTGRIEGSISGTSITLDFVEYWHSPHKTIRYTGSKL